MDNNMNIYALDLHDRCFINVDLHIMRVPGGWIYEVAMPYNQFSAVFVPFDGEFINTVAEE